MGPASPSELSLKAKGETIMSHNLWGAFILVYAIAGMILLAGLLRTAKAASSLSEEEHIFRPGALDKGKKSGDRRRSDRFLTLPPVVCSLF